MSSPADDEDGAAAPADPAATAPDPALSYPRGNRLGIRHPRPTVVIVVAVLVVLAGGFVWSLVQPAEASFCQLTGTSGPLGSDPVDAFEAWYEQGGADQAFVKASRDDPTMPASSPSTPPSIDDFERSGDEWNWTVDDRTRVKVEVGGSRDSDGYRVSGVNRCEYGTPEQLGVSGP
jgi:hypothetical protein